MFKSAYRIGHSSETAFTRIHNDILLAIDDNSCVILVFLDLSAAFDTVDHDILLGRLEHRKGLILVNVLLDRLTFTSMLTTRSYTFRLTQKLLENRCTHYLVFSRASAILPAGWHQTSWFWTVRRLNSLCSTLQCYRPRPPLESITVGRDVMHVSHAAKNIRVWFDEFLMAKQVKVVCRSAFFHLRNIAKIRKYMSFTHCKILIHAFITSKLDYCNSLLSGLRQDHINKLQPVEYSAERLLTGTRKHECFTHVKVSSLVTYSGKNWL